MKFSNSIKKVFALLNLDVKKKQDFEAIVLMEVLKNSDSPIIFDIGAYIGEKTLYYKKIFPNSIIYSFEPYNDSFQILKKNTFEIPSITLENLAVCDKTYKTTFSVKTNFDQGNSLLESANEEFGAIAKEILKESKKILVDTISIDDYMKNNNITKVNLLKLDIQGAELMALKGATIALEKKLIDYIYLEAQFLKMYKDQPMFHDICKYLHDLDYRIYNFFGGNSIGYQLRETNVLFYNKNLKNEIV